jgi:hypothetical protein
MLSWASPSWSHHVVVPAASPTVRRTIRWSAVGLRPDVGASAAERIGARSGARPVPCAPARGTLPARPAAGSGPRRSCDLRSAPRATGSPASPARTGGVGTSPATSPDGRCREPAHRPDGRCRRADADVVSSSCSPRRPPGLRQPPRRERAACRWAGGRGPPRGPLHQRRTACRQPPSPARVRYSAGLPA